MIGILNLSNRDLLPIPESSRILGDSMAPAHRMVSCLHLMVYLMRLLVSETMTPVTFFCSISSLFSKSILCTCVFGITVKFFL